PSEVVVRAPGSRYFGDPQPIKDEALADLPFALMSQAAYQREPDSDDPCTSECLDPDKELVRLGWIRWLTFPNDTLKRQIADYHLRVEVWSNNAARQVAVSFGGTEFHNFKDWKANLRWFIPRRDDEYTELVKKVGPAFVDEYIHRRVNDPEYRFL